MKQSNKEIDSKYKAIDLYKIVLDIEKYPTYIPWCSKIDILRKQKNEIEANMIVNYKFFPTQRFASKVIFNDEEFLIKTFYINGPLKDLETTWNFIQVDKNQSKVLFGVEFEFKNFLHQKLAELFFPLVEEKMINSFIKRADQILD
jgi:coenzyme Q-binding protein COQ10